MLKMINVFKTHPYLFVLLLLSIALFVIYVSFTLTKRPRKKQTGNFTRKNRRYLFYNDFFLVRSNFRKIYNQVAGLSVYNLMEARVVTVGMFEKSMLLSIAFFVAAFLAYKDIVTGILIFLLSRVFMDFVVYDIIDEISSKVKTQLLHALTALYKSYVRCRNIPDAIHDIKVGPYIQKSFDNLYSILTLSDGKDRLAQFYRETPNRTMKTLATVSWVLNDQGDASMLVNAHSINSFQLAIQMLKSDLSIEELTHKKRRRLFKTIPYLPLVPIPLYPLLAFVLMKIFPAVSIAYDGVIGYVSKILLLLACFVCYYTVSTINSNNVARIDDRLRFLRNLLQNEKILKFAESLQSYSLLRRHKLQAKIEHSLSNKTLPYLYFERFVFSIVSFVFAVIVSLVIVSASKEAIYNNIIPSTLTTKVQYTEQEVLKVRQMDADILVLDNLPDADTLIKRIRVTLPRITETEVETQLNRIQSKYNSYRNTRFYWWFSFIYLGAAILGSCLPLYLLNLRSKVVTAEAQLDVLQLQTVIAILSTTTLDTMDVILWLSKSSDIHKDVLITCYHEYAMDPQQAIYKLRRASTVPEFTSMCDDLLTTIHMVSLEEAFSNLVTDRESTLKEREFIETESLKQKRSAASSIVMFPIKALAVLGLILPIGYLAYMSAVSTLSNFEMK